MLADKEVLSLAPESENIGKYSIYPYQEIELGGGCRIIPLPSNHRTENDAENCFNFLIADDKNLLYALDSSPIGCPYYDYLRDVFLDVIIFDAAEELLPPTERLLMHGSFETALLLKGILTSRKCVAQRSKFILSHIPSSKKRSIHQELLTAAEGQGISIAYDGYYLNI